MLLLHGLNHHAEAWVRNIATIAAGGYRVVALDLPGFGRSGMPTMSYSLPGYSAFVSQFLDALGVRQAHLVGNSMGGAIAFRFAIDQPERVLSLAGVDPAGMFQRVPWVWTLAAQPWVRVLLRPILGRRRLLWESHKRAYHDPSVASATQVDRMAEAYLQPGYRDHLLAMAETMFTAPDADLLWDRLPGLRMPVAIFWGRQDRTIPVQHAYRAAHRIPHAQLFLYDRCGHNPMYEKADLFNRDLLDFLDRSR
ncbi:MAG: alpha/beta fold hydrolase [Candidatus Dormibacteria bacterium]